jgi:hypothetical protein
MISTELTKNTQRVVEVAVKSEIRDTVLPSLENITRNEVKMAMNEHLGRGLGDYVQKVGHRIEFFFLWSERLMVIL